jgi:hypothetical protein
VKQDVWITAHLSEVELNPCKSLSDIHGA